MPRKIFTRKEIKDRLKGKIEKKEPVIGAGSSCGLVAMCAEKGGAELIIVYSTGISRLRGLPTSHNLGHSNKMTLEMADEILNVVKDSPVICGIEACDASSWDLHLLINRFMDAGFSGIINFPTIGLHEKGTMWRTMKESVGLGFAREVEMIKLAADMDIFTMAYVFTPQEAQEMAEAGLDCLVPHAGGTSGGMQGFATVGFEEGAKVVQDMIDSAKKINPGIICLAHGGPFAEPGDTGYLYKHTDAVGFVGASSIERIPIEKAVTGIIKEFKTFKI